MRSWLTKLVERWTPLFLASFLLVLNWSFFKIYPVQNFKDLLNGALNLGSISIGFLTASQAVLLSIDEKYVVKQLKNAGVYKKLVQYFLNAIQSAFILVVISIFCLGIEIDFLQSQSFLGELLFNIWFFFCVETIASCYRVISVFSKILAK
jgi:hypothetical protein